MQLDTPNKLSPMTITLHWIVGVTIIGLLALGVYMVESETIPLYSWHKSFGFLILFVILLRIIWRLKNGWPTPVGQYSNIEQILGKVVHWTLLLGTLFLPVSGFLMSSLGGYGVNAFGLEIIARNVDPENLSKVLAHNKDIAELFKSTHHWLGYVIISAIALHVSGAFKHHLIDKDATLKRMLKKRT